VLLDRRAIVQQKLGCYNGIVLTCLVALFGYVVYNLVSFSRDIFATLTVLTTLSVSGYLLLPACGFVMLYIGQGLYINLVQLHHLRHLRKIKVPPPPSSPSIWVTLKWDLSRRRAQGAAGADAVTAQELLGNLVDMLVNTDSFFTIIGITISTSVLRTVFTLLLSTIITALTGLIKSQLGDGS
jgi:hypothetical protein